MRVEMSLELLTIALGSAAGLAGCLGLAVYAAAQRARADRLDRELDEILDCISEGVVIYDSEMRLVRCNERFRETYALTAPALVKGAGLRDILRFGVRAGQWPEAVDREEQWIEERISVQSNPHKEMLTQVGQDRWILVRNMKGPNGETIGVRADVTELETAKRDAEKKSAALEDLNLRVQSALDEITFHAHNDALTGLFNRRRFDQIIESESDKSLLKSDSEELHVLHIDLDHFKFVNDTFGHAAGDEILKNTAEIIRSAIGRNDFAARTGGDEFVIIMTESRSRHEWLMFAEALIERLKSPILYEEKNIAVGASIGIASSERSTRALRQAIVNADSALYAAKAHGRNGAQYFTSRFVEDQQRQMGFRNILETALQNQEITPYYQPQFDAASLTCIGAEALARWRHPSGELLTPGAFAWSAAQDVLLKSLDQTIFRRVCDDYEILRDLGCAPEKISVNISAVSLNSLADWPELDRQAVRDHAIALELLEAIALDAPGEAFKHQIDALKERGVEFEVDDFGSERASIIGLTIVSPKRLKIDKRLVLPAPTSAAYRALIKAILEMAAALDIEVIAEGVETSDHVHCLRDLGCQALQGFALAHPMPFEDFKHMLAGGGEAARRAAGAGRV